MAAPLQSNNLVVALGLVLTVAAPAAAQIGCGDTLGPGGKFVAAGPIGPCPQNPALTVVGPVKVDFAGNELSCTVDTNDGVLILGKGATVENGSVTGCAAGVRVEGEGKHKLTWLVARDNASDGFRVAPGADGNKFKECTSVRNGAEGFLLDRTDKNALTGCRSARNGDAGFTLTMADGNKLKDLTSSNDADGGVTISGQNNKLTDVDVIESGINGVSVGGGGNILKDVTATASAADGFNIANGTGHKLTKCAAVASGSVGFHVGAAASATKISKCRSIQNTTEGIKVEDGATTSKIEKNVSLHNDGDDLVDLNAGCGTTIWKKNLFNSSNPAPGGCIE